MLAISRLFAAPPLAPRRASPLAPRVCVCVCVCVPWGGG
eukprot:COSAG01_NODE_3999_length_5446_cov_4.154853_10_plen_38_part_01